MQNPYGANALQVGRCPLHLVGSLQILEGTLEDRFAQSAGASGLTLLRFFERSSTAYGTASRGADEIAKATKRVKTLAEIWEVVANAFSSGA